MIRNKKEFFHIAIVDDEEEYRESIKEYINNQQRYKCLYSSGSMESFLYEIRGKPELDAVLLDIGLPGMSGISGIKLIKEKYPDIPIVILSVHNDSKLIFDALRAGASGYILKSTPFNKLSEYLAMLYLGGAPMSHQIAQKVIEFFHATKKSEKISPLSQREKEVVEGLVDGLSYKAIAERLHVSHSTIYAHIRNIYKKLHVHSKADVIRKSLREEI